jgi:hypothetical protein
LVRRGRRYGRKERWFRILHATTGAEERASRGMVQRILGDISGTLQPADLGGAGNNGVA